MQPTTCHLLSSFLLFSHLNTGPATAWLSAPFNKRPHVFPNRLRSLRFLPGSFSTVYLLRPSGIIRTCHLKTGCLRTLPTVHTCTSLSQTTGPWYKQPCPCRLCVDCGAQRCRDHPSSRRQVRVIYLVPLTVFLLPTEAYEMLLFFPPKLCFTSFLLPPSFIACLSGNSGY